MKLPNERRDTSDLAADILRWTDGWVCSRGVASPTPVAGGVHILVGSENERARYVLTTPDAERAGQLATQVSRFPFWIKWPAAPCDAEPMMPLGWTIIEHQFLMSAQLKPSALRLPDGYHIALDDEGDVLEARVTSGSGALAASGRMGLATLAVPDQIITQVDHQRRGLGKAIMGALSNAALDRGRSHAILLASGQGRHLYETLGWRVLSPFWAAVRLR